MKKWLVGLLAASLCATSAWADDVLTRETTGVSGNSYAAWTATGASGAEYAGNSAGGNDSIQLKSKDSTSGIVMTKSAGSDVASVTVQWNDNTAVARTNQIYGSTTAYSSPADLYGDAKGELLGEIARDATTFAVPAGYPFIGIRSKNGAVYLTSVTIGFADSSAFSVAFDKEDGFEVVEGTESSITAEAKNGSGDYSYAWTGDLTGSSATLVLADTLAVGDYTVTVTATDNGADDVTATATIHFSVVAAPEFSVTFDKENWFTNVLGQANTITAIPANGIEPYTFLWESDTPELDGGTTDTLQIPATLAEGDYTVACLVTEDDGAGDAINALIGFHVEAAPVITGDTYELVKSDEDFAPGADYVIVALKADTFCSAMKCAATNDRIAVKEVEIVNDAVVTDDPDIVWTIAAGADGKYTLYNAAQDLYAAAPAKDEAKARLLADGTTNAAQWTISVATNQLVTIGDSLYSRWLARNGQAKNAYFADYKGETKPFLFKKGGASSPYITYEGDTAVTLPDGSFEIQFTLQNNEQEFTWGVEGEGSISSVGTYTWAPTTAGDYTIKVTAIAGELLLAEKEVVLTVNDPAVISTITVSGVLNGEVVASVNGTPVEQAESGTTVTLTATAHDGYKFVSMSATYGDTIIPFTTATGTFVMPTEAVTVTAEFEEFDAPPYYFTFETGTNIGYAATAAVFANTGSTQDDVPTVDFTVQRVFRGSKEGEMATDKKVGSFALRMAPLSTNSAYAYNSTAFAEALTAISFQYGIYGTDTCQSFTVSTSEDGENWTQLGDDLAASATTTGLTTYENSSLPENTYFIRFDTTSTVSQNNRRLDIDEIMLWTGAPKPSITYAGETEVGLPGGAFEIEFTLKNGGDEAFAWSLAEGNPGAIDGAGVYTWEPTEPGDYSIKVSATRGGILLASKTVALKVNGPVVTYTVTVDEDIENGSITASPLVASEGDTITLTATADPGYKLDHFLLGDVAFTEYTFPMPAQDVTVSAVFVEKPVLPGVTYTITGTNTAEITSGEAPEGSTFEYASTYNRIYQLTSPNSMTLTLKGYEGYKVTGLTLSMHSNGSKGAGSLSATCGDATIASIEDSNFKGGWYTDYTTNWVAVTPAVTATEIDGDIVITITASVNSLYCESITVEYEAVGPAEFSVTFNKANGFTVEYGTADSITAEAKNGVIPYTYSWSSDTPELNGTGATLAIPATLEAGDYTVQVEVTDSELNRVDKQISFSVVPLYTVSVYDGIQHGTVELSVDGGEAVPGPVDVAAGTSVQVIATPESRSYEVDEIIVTDEDGAPITVAADGTFTMPESDVYVTATFEEVVIGTDQYVKISTTAALEEGEYVITGAKAGESEYAMLNELAGNNTTKYIPRDTDAVEVVDGVITGPDESIVWTLAQGEHGWTIYNAAETAGYVGYVKSGNTAGYETNATEKSSWTITANEDGLFAVVNVADDTRNLRYNYNSGQERFACYAPNTSGSLTGAALAFYKKETGPAEPTITFTGETTVQLPDGAFSLQFTPKNYDGAFEWVLDSREGGSIDAESGLYTWVPTEAGDVTIKVIARNGELDIASLEVPLTVEDEPGPQPGEPALVIGGDTTGIIGVPVTFTVTPVNFGDDVDIFLDGVSFPDDSNLDPETDVSYEWPNVTFTPDYADIEGVTYTFNFWAEDGDGNTAIATAVILVETAPPPAQKVAITSLKIANGVATVTTDVDISAVYGTTDVTTAPETWTAVDATLGDKSATIPVDGSWNFLRAE